MRRIANFTIAMVVCAALAICFLVAVPNHSKELKNNAGSCSASCHQQGQPALTNTQSSRENEDDLEPAPPFLLQLNIPCL